MILRLADAVRRGAEWLSMLLLLVMLVVTVAGLAARYLFNRPLAWGDELGIILLLWCVFIADAFVTRDNDHIAFDLVWDGLSPKSRRVLLMLQCIVVVPIFAYALPTVVDYIMFLRREITSALQWRLDLVFACFAIYLAMVVVRLVAKFVRVCGSNWRDETASSDVTETANVIG